MHFIIRTKRLILRPFQVEDAPMLNKIANQDNVLKWMPDWKSSVLETEKLIKWFILQYPAANKHVARVMFAVELCGNVIGMAGIGNKEEVNNEIEIAYFISESFIGKGYASEAVMAVSHWALDTLQMDYLIAIVETDNFPSQRVVEKCGYSKIGTRMIVNSGESLEKPFIYYRLYSSI